jgi:hypothetical protein
MLNFIRELISYFLVRKKFYLLPIVILSVILGVLIVLSKGSAVAPFIYTLF